MKFLPLIFKISCDSVHQTHSLVCSAYWGEWRFPLSHPLGHTPMRIKRQLTEHLNPFKQETIFNPHRCFFQNLNMNSVSEFKAPIIKVVGAQFTEISGGNGWSFQPHVSSIFSAWKCFKTKKRYMWTGLLNILRFIPIKSKLTVLLVVPSDSYHFRILPR